MSEPSRIFVVDDERQILRALKVILREADDEAIEAATMKDALDRAAVRPPDAAIVDLMLSDGSGVELCRRLREWSSMPSNAGRPYTLTTASRPMRSASSICALVPSCPTLASPRCAASPTRAIVCARPKMFSGRALGARPLRIDRLYSVRRFDRVGEPLSGGGSQQLLHTLEVRDDLEHVSDQFRVVSLSLRCMPVCAYQPTTETEAVCPGSDASPLVDRSSSPPN